MRFTLDAYFVSVRGTCVCKLLFPFLFHFDSCAIFYSLQRGTRAAAREPHYKANPFKTQRRRGRRRRRPFQSKMFMCILIPSVRSLARSLTQSTLDVSRLWMRLSTKDCSVFGFCLFGYFFSSSFFLSSVAQFILSSFFVNRKHVAECILHTLRQTDWLAGRKHLHWRLDCAEVKRREKLFLFFEKFHRSRALAGKYYRHCVHRPS